ncbi:MAG: GtrA family protein [Acidimicrobiia bacterium]
MKNYLKTFLNRETFWQFFRMGIVGGFNTAVGVGLFNLFSLVVGLSLFLSALWAYLIATGISYLLNRRWTFRIPGTYGGVVESVGFYVVNLISGVVQAGLVELADILWGPLNPFQANLAFLLAIGVVALPKFASYRDVVFRRSMDGNTERS